MLTSCANDEYTITCEIGSNTKGENVVIYKYDENSRSSSPIDTAFVIDGKAVFEGIINKDELCLVVYDGVYINFILESGTINIDFNSQSIGGTYYNDILSLYQSESDSIQNVFAKQYDDIAYNVDLSRDERTERLSLLFNEYCYKTIEHAEKIIANNKNNSIGRYAFWMDIAYNQNVNYNIYKKYLSTAGDYIASFGPIKMQTLRFEALKKTEIGEKFTNIKFNDTISISNFVGNGKYTLFEVWTTNNEQCSNNLQYINRVFENFDSQKISIVSVACDDNIKNLQNAINQRATTWTNVIDEKSSIIDVYGISSLPFVMIISPDSTIVARGLRDNAIEHWLKAEFDK